MTPGSGEHARLFDADRRGSRCGAAAADEAEEGRRGSTTVVSEGRRRPGRTPTPVTGLRHLAGAFSGRPGRAGRRSHAAPAGRRGAPGRPPPDRRRRWLGQDPGADPPHRPPPGHRRCAAVGHPRHHLHQQGGRTRCARVWPNWSARPPRRCGSRPSTRRACAFCAPTPTASATALPSRSTTTPTRAA